MSRDRLIVFGATAVLLALLLRPEARAVRSSRAPPGSTAPTGLTFRLSEGSEGPPPTARPPAVSEPLSADETQRVLDRLPPLTADPEEENDFALREGSLPPPRTGTTVKDPFPPPPGPPPPDAGAGGPLQVLRRAPEGEVPSPRT